MLEATMHALRHPAYSQRYQRNKQRLGKQRGAKVAQVNLARKLTEAIWHMLSTNQPFDPAAAGHGSIGRYRVPMQAATIRRGRRAPLTAASGPIAAGQDDHSGSGQAGVTEPLADWPWARD